MQTLKINNGVVTTQNVKNVTNKSGSAGKVKELWPVLLHLVKHSNGMLNNETIHNCKSFVAIHRFL